MAQKDYYCLEPAKFRLDGGAMFGIIPKPLWNSKAPADQHNRIDLALRLWLIKTTDRVILIDTGIGDYHGEKFDQQFDVRSVSSPLEKCLNQLNLSHHDVTDLVISHMHFDHIGGIGQKVGTDIVPVFQKARLHLHRQHYDYAHNPTERDKGSFHTHTFTPIVEYYRKNNKIVWHDGEEGTLIELAEGNIHFLCSHGHTPYLMHPYDEKMIYLADLIPTSHHVHIPWVMGYDIAPGETTRNKRKFLEFIREKKLAVIYEHDPEYCLSTIDVNEKGKFRPTHLLAAPDSMAYPISL